VTEALARAFRQAERLSEKGQQELADPIDRRLSDLRWDALLAKPESRAFLRDLEHEADDESGLEVLEASL